MKHRGMRQAALVAVVTALVGAVLLTGCGGVPSAREDPTPPTSTASPSSAPSPSGERVAGTVVRFTAGDTAVDVTIGDDSPATRDFVSMLPMTLELKEFNGREKIADLPRQLRWQGSPGSDPEDGDLIYYVPWGNIGFYYDASGIGYSDQTIHLGTYDATKARLAEFEGRETRVAVVE